MQDIGDRFKSFYEGPSKNYLIRRIPVICRLDGNAFHTFTKNFKKPFDLKFINSMYDAALQTSHKMQGFKIAYIQSDEASFLLTDYDTLQTDAWFGYNKSKIESISASMFTRYFANNYPNDNAFFDSRSFNVPKEEIVNYFLWRAKDWERNSLQMYCRSFFSDKQMLGKNREQQHEMLYSINRNWANDLSENCKNGVFLVNTNEGLKTVTTVKPNYEEISNLLREARGITC
jgi:tRNA(His) 5'-end guanylyltransferase